MNIGDPSTTNTDTCTVEGDLPPPVKTNKRGRPRKYPLPDTLVATAPRGHPGTSYRSEASTSRGYQAASGMVIPAEEMKMTSSARQMRNLAEKMRRDKLNAYVSELSSIVPVVNESPKKVDKISVLRLAANYIRMHNLLGSEKSTNQPLLPADLPTEAATGLIETIGNQFLLVITNTGKTVFISDSVEQIFGHTQLDLLGNNIFNVVHPEDHDLLKNHLQPKDTPSRSFFIRFSEKMLSRNEMKRYEIVHIQGKLKPVPPPPKEEYPLNPMDDIVIKQEFGESEPPLKQRRSTRHYGTIRLCDDGSETEERDSKAKLLQLDTHLLVALVKIIKDRPITALSRIESTRDEYITRHDANGAIMYSDHRISYVTGYFPEQVFGLSAFEYMHAHDILWTMIAHKRMFGTDTEYGEVAYRLRCVDDSYVTLRSRGYLEYNKQTGKLESFVCINTILSEKEAKKIMDDQKGILHPFFGGEDLQSTLAFMSTVIAPDVIAQVKDYLKREGLMSSHGNVQPSTSSATITELDSSSTKAVKSKVNRQGVPLSKKWVNLNEPDHSYMHTGIQKRKHSKESLGLVPPNTSGIKMLKSDQQYYDQYGDCPSNSKRYDSQYDCNDPPYTLPNELPSSLHTVMSSESNIYNPSSSSTGVNWNQQHGHDMDICQDMSDIGENINTPTIYEPYPTSPMLVEHSQTSPYMSHSPSINDTPTFNQMMQQPSPGLDPSTIPYNNRGEDSLSNIFKSSDVIPSCRIDSQFLIPSTIMDTSAGGNNGDYVSYSTNSSRTNIRSKNQGSS